MKLYVEAERGDLPAIRDLLESGADPNIEFLSGLTMSPLARAAICDEPESIRALVAGGAKVDLPLTYELSGGIVTGSTALMWASHEGSTSAVKALLAAGADVNARDCAVNMDTGGCYSRKTALDHAKTAEIRALLRAAGGA